MIFELRRKYAGYVFIGRVLCYALSLTVIIIIIIVIVVDTDEFDCLKIRKYLHF